MGSTQTPRIVMVYDFEPDGDVASETIEPIIRARTGLEVVRIGRHLPKPHSRLAHLRLRLLYVRLLARAARAMGPQDHVVFWQQDMAVLMCLFWRLTGLGRGRRVYILNTTSSEARQKGVVRRILAYALALPNIRYYSVQATADIAYVSRVFPRLAAQARLFFMPVVSLPDRVFERDRPLVERLGRFFLSSGRSNRKFDFFIDYFRNRPDLKYVIVNDSFKGDPGLPNVEILRDVGGDSYYSCTEAAEAILLDLKDKAMAGGHTVFVHALQLGAPIILTRSATLDDYVDPDRNCIVIEDGDAAALDAAIARLSDPAERAAMSARQKADHQSRFSMPALGERIAAMVRGEA